MTTVLILGSGPNVVNCKDWPREPFDKIIAINNAWAVRPDWDFSIHPEDFPPERRPQALAGNQAAVTAADYVPVQNTYGGFVYAGGTMAFTAAYWALGALRPTVIAMLGCDMVYAGSQTHFYGKGTADPLRDDISLRNLEAKSARLSVLAARDGCAVVNMSTEESRLTVPRATLENVGASKPLVHDKEAADSALLAERQLGYVVPSGRYWESADRFEPAKLDAIDALWLKAARLT